jgi:demethylmenaquinone methyltransferase/2-methoxy-6-polyprenyl-1,4-benzoquinol methylase
MTNQNKLTRVLPEAEAKPAYVNEMFARIAGHYDQLNSLMTLGQDRQWRREALALTDLPFNGSLLDVGTGTGKIAKTAHQIYPAARICASDFTWEMVQAGHSAAGTRNVYFSIGDTFRLPFDDNEFDAVISGFMMRNVVDRRAAFLEQRRVTKPGGRVVCLETSPPHVVALGPLFRLYFFTVVPILGGLLAGDVRAYSYLPASTVDFPAPADLARVMELAGLRNVIYRTLMFGSVAIHVGTK